MEISDVKDLIAFDEQTMKEVKDIYQKKALVVKQIAEEKEELAKSTWAEVKEKVAMRKAELDLKIAEDKKKSEEEYQRLAGELQKRFTEKREQWKKDIYEACIK